MEPEQDLVPLEVSSIIGLPLNTKILFFAGAYGDWAICLAKEGMRIKFTDISKNKIAKVREKYRDCFTVIAQKDGLNLPEMKTDEILLSFEPTPLYGGPFLFFLLRALALSKGVMIIQRPYLYPSPETELSFFCKLYGIENHCTILPFLCRKNGKRRYLKYLLTVNFLSADKRTKKVLLRDFAAASQLLTYPLDSSDLRTKLKGGKIRKQTKNKRLSKLITFASWTARNVRQLGLKTISRFK